MKEVYKLIHWNFLALVLQQLKLKTGKRCQIKKKYSPFSLKGNIIFDVNFHHYAINHFDILSYSILTIILQLKYISFPVVTLTLTIFTIFIQNVTYFQFWEFEFSVYSFLHKHVDEYMALFFINC
jgi:hypothetical protein